MISTKVCIVSGFIGMYGVIIYLNTTLQIIFMYLELYKQRGLKYEVAVLQYLVGTSNWKQTFMVRGFLVKRFFTQHLSGSYYKTCTIWFSNFNCFYSAFKMDTSKIRVIFEYEFRRGTSAAKMPRNMNAEFGEETPDKRTLHFWFKRSRNGNFDVTTNHVEHSPHMWITLNWKR